MDILKSRRFWTMLVGILTALLLHYFGGSDTEFLIQTLTPLVMLLIAAYTIDDIAEMLATAIVERASLLAGDGKHEMLLEELKDELRMVVAEEVAKANNGL